MADDEHTPEFHDLQAALDRAAAIAEKERPDLVPPEQLRVLRGADQAAAIKAVHNRLLVKPAKRDVGHWERGWLENLEEFRRTNEFEALRPRYLARREHILRWKGHFVWADDPYYEWKWYRNFFDTLSGIWMTGDDHIVEFGCGSGHNLAALKQKWPKRTVVGCDWSDAAVEIADLLTGRGLKFNMLDPNERVDIKGDTVFTVGAMEQTGQDWQNMLGWLLWQKPRRVIHVEPFIEAYDPTNPVDVSAILAHRRRGFWEGYLYRLGWLQERGNVEIERWQVTGFGSLLTCGYNVLVWRSL